MIEKLSNTSLGKYKVRTLSGSAYFIFIGADDMYIYRINGKSHLRRDEQKIKLLSIIELRIGKRMKLLLEPLDSKAFQTLRVSTDVVEITQLENM